MVKRTSKLFVSALLITSSLAAHASNNGPGKITSVLPIGNGTVLFNLDGSRTAQPGCATAPGRWAIDASTPSGQSKLAVLLTAYALGKKINVIGSGECNVWVDTETVDWFATVD